MESMFLVRSGREVDQSPENMWSHISTFAYAFVTYTGTALSLPLMFYLDLEFELFFTFVVSCQCEFLLTGPYLIKNVLSDKHTPKGLVARMYVLVVMSVFLF